MFFPCDIMILQIDQNVTSGKSVKNAPTSQNQKIFKNGRTRLVYASFWPHGPPRVQRTGLGWIPQLVRPPEADSWFFREISTEAHKPKNPSAPTFESENVFQKLFFDNQISFPWIYDMPAPFWYFHIFRTPSRSISLSFWNLNVNFSLWVCITLFWNHLYY